MTAHQADFDTVGAQADVLIQRAHFAGAGQVAEALARLADKIDRLKRAAGARGIKLRQSLQAQQYYLEAAEADEWLRERYSIVRAMEGGRGDADSALALQRRLDSIERDVTGSRNPLSF